MLRRVLSLAALLSSVVAANAFADVCPLSQFTLGTTVVKSALAVDTRIFTGGGARYSIPVGVLQTGSHCTGAGCTSNAGVYIEDLFTVSGPPPGTLVPITAHLLLDTPSATCSANIQDTHGGLASISSPQDGDELILPVAGISGQPFQLHFEIACSNVGSSPGSLGGTFSFTGLPPGTGITSCHGYLNGTPVAAHESSWGRVKILYR